MKIALVTPFYFPVLGGYTLITHGLYNVYRRKGHEVYILTPMCDEAHKNEQIITFDSREITRTEQKETLKDLNFWEKTFGLREMTNIQKDMVLEIEKIKPDIVHTFGAVQFAFVGTMISKRNIKWIHSFITQPPNRLSFIKRMMVKKVFKRANLITTSAKSQIKDIKENYDLVVSKAIRVGVDITEFSPPTQFNQSPIVGTVSNFVWKEKVEGLLILIKSFKKVVLKYPNAELRIVGEGQYKNIVKKMAENHGLEKNVTLLGRRGREELGKFYQEISVFAHISKQDTLPLTVLEAMASGLPIVASNIGDIPQFVTKDVGFVTSFDEETIAQSLLRLLDSKELRLSLGEKARYKAKTELSWDIVADEYLTTYRDLLLSGS
jgi:glycosyltransferase involved in cell wall biosynthesis